MKYMSILGGNFSGKIGNLVFYTYRSEQFCRLAPGKRSKPDTPAQKAWQEVFKTSGVLLRPLAEVLRLGLIHKNSEKGRWLSVASKNLLNKAVYKRADDYFLDYSRIELSKGSLWTADTKVYALNQELRFCWRFFSAVNSYAGDLAVLLAYNKNRQRWVYTIGQFKRADEAAVLKLPCSASTEDYEVYMFFFNAERKTASRTAYLGKVAV